MTDDLESKVAKLEKQVTFLLEKRILQTDITPSVVKTRHMGEANRYILTGLEADLPSGESFGSSCSAYFASDTNKLWIWNGSAYKSTTLT
jgi:hypothetical protein